MAVIINSVDSSYMKLKNEFSKLEIANVFRFPNFLEMLVVCDS